MSTTTGAQVYGPIAAGCSSTGVAALAAVMGSTVYHYRTRSGLHFTGVLQMTLAGLEPQLGAYQIDGSELYTLYMVSQRTLDLLRLERVWPEAGSEARDAS